MREFFKPDDFEDFSHWGLLYPTMYVAKMANEKLNALIEASPVVYGIKDKEQWIFSSNFSAADFSGHLMFIEEIVKEECKHEPSKLVGFRMSVDLPGNEYYKHVTKCQYCDAELVAKWEAK